MAGKSFYNDSAGVHLGALNNDDLELLRLHKNTKRVALELEGQSTPDLDFLLQCQQLEELVIYGGKVGNYSAISMLTKLKRLFMNGRLRKWLETFEFIDGAVALEKLQIMHYPMFTTFPDLGNCTKLELVEVQGCKRLKDISNIMRIPNLKGLAVSSPLLEIDDMEFLAEKPGLVALNGSLGSKNKDKQLMSMLERHGLKPWLE